MKRLFCIALLALASTSAIAADVASAGSAAGKPKKKLICKLEKPVGSQMVKRICMTEEQADVQRELARRELGTPSKR